MSETVVVLFGPSGCGKQTLIRETMERRPGVFRFTVSMTSRSPRNGEVDGVHYHFRTREAFQEAIENGELLEWAEVHGNLYGTPRSEILPGMMNIADVDIQGVRQMKLMCSEVGAELQMIAIFVTTVSIDTLRERIVKRDPDLDPKEIEKRMKTAIEERLIGPEIADHTIFNENGQLDRALKQLEQLLFP